MINTIIWDWNGTLLNDTDICLESMNYMLEKRNKPALSKKRYREIFTFPVRNYYIEAGFDFNLESFDTVAIEFMDLYFYRLNNADIFMKAMEVLNSLKQDDMRQVLISAMEHLSLVSSVKEKGLYDYFDHISGIQDHFAAGKIENAKQIVKDLKLDLNRTLLIGDTIHDFEVATELGVKCLLIADGHQSMERLENLGCEVAGDLGVVPDIIFSKKTFILS
jgi:phosphoglycolate phosphatase